MDWVCRGVAPWAPHRKEEGAPTTGRPLRLFDWTTRCELVREQRGAVLEEAPRARVLSEAERDPHSSVYECSVRTARINEMEIRS